jgi:hypothetical protein
MSRSRIFYYHMLAGEITGIRAAITFGIVLQAVHLSGLYWSGGWEPVTIKKERKNYRLSILMPVKSCATDLMSFTPKAVCTCSSSSWFAASHI